MVKDTLEDGNKDIDQEMVFGPIEKVIVIMVNGPKEKAKAMESISLRVILNISRKGVSW